MFGSGKKTGQKQSPLFLEQDDRRYKLDKGNVIEYTGNGLKHEFNFRSGVMHTYEVESYTYRFADLERYVLRTSVGLKDIPDQALARIEEIGLRISKQIIDAGTPENTQWTTSGEDQIAQARAFIKACEPG